MSIALRDRMEQWDLYRLFVEVVSFLGVYRLKTVASLPQEWQEQKQTALKSARDFLLNALMGLDNEQAMKEKTDIGFADLNGDSISQIVDYDKDYQQVASMFESVDKLKTFLQDTGNFLGRILKGEIAEKTEVEMFITQFIRLVHYFG